MEASITESGEITDGALVDTVRRAFDDALAGGGTLDPDVLAMDGMSGRKYRLFINRLIRCLPDARYLEVGSLAGSTLCSAINGNTVRAVAVDNWSEFGGPREAFFTNLSRYRTPQADVRVVERDFRRVDYAALGRFNVYLFDGPHAAQDQYDGIALALPALDDTFILVVDDWNWHQVRSGTLAAIERLRLSIDYRVEVRSTLDDTHPAIHGPASDWHNGYFIAVLKQPAGAGVAPD